MNYIITTNSITVLINNIPEIINDSHENFNKIENALKNNATEDEIQKLINLSKKVQDFVEETEGKIQVKNGEVFYNNKVVHSALTKRIISLMNKGFDISPFTKFMENLYKNPSNRAVNETYGFLEACNLPITEDGKILMYKKVTKDYKDCFTKTIDNSIGKTVEVPRNEVDEDSNKTCSYGLHVASYSYMAHYPGDRIIICKVDPCDVVAVPNDHNNSKMRVCKYIVVNEVNIKDEEIPENVIKDKDVYCNVLLPFENINDALLSVRKDSYKKITRRLNITEIDIKDDLFMFKIAFNTINNRTKNWRNKLLNFFDLKYETSSETPTKISEEYNRKFRDKVLKILEQLDKENIKILIKFLYERTTINKEFISSGITLREYIYLANAIAVSHKNKEFKKKNFLNLFNI